MLQAAVVALKMGAALQHTLAMKPRRSLLEEMRRMLPPVRSPCRMSRLCR